MKIIEAKLNWASALAKRSTIDMIVLHHAAAKQCTIYNIHNWHLANGWSGCGYHFFINKNGEIYRGRPENTIGAHATNHNSNSIGICFQGDFEKEYPSQAQIDAGLELVDYLKKKYDIKKVKGHGELMSISCPGKFFSIEQFRGEKENLILSFQRAAVADGFKLPKYGCDGSYGDETKAVMQKCIVKRRLFYKYQNSTKLVQRLLGIKQDGLVGKDTESAIKAFQKKHGLVIDGCVGLKTWEKLLCIK